MSFSHLNVTVTPSTGMVRVGGERRIQRSVAVEGTFDKPNAASAAFPEAVYHAYQYALASTDRISGSQLLSVEEDKSVFSSFLNRLGTALTAFASIANCQAAFTTEECGTSPTQRSDAKIYSADVINSGKKQFRFTLVSDGTDVSLGDVRTNLIKMAPANDDTDTVEYIESVKDYESRVVKKVSDPEGLGLVTSNAVEESIVKKMPESDFEPHLRRAYLDTLMTSR